jgi:hypothetical protein
MPSPQYALTSGVHMSTGALPANVIAVPEPEVPPELCAPAAEPPVLEARVPAAPPLLLVLVEFPPDEHDTAPHSESKATTSPIARFGSKRTSKR